MAAAKALDHMPAATSIAAIADAFSVDIPAAAVCIADTKTSVALALVSGGCFLNRSSQLIYSCAPVLTSM